MFTLTAPARAELDTFFADRESSPIRIYLAPGGCSGPRLALALDTPGEEDTVFDQDGYSFCANTGLFEAAKSFTVDFTPMGFSVQSELELGGGGCSPSCCSGCGGGCSS